MRDRAMFRLVRDEGVRARAGTVGVAYAPLPDGVFLAFAIGKVVGNSVTRNRARRVLRDEFARLEVPTGAYVVRVAAPIQRSEQLRASLRSAVGAVTGGEA